MRLLVDLQSLHGPARNRGLGRYSTELAAALARHPSVESIGVLFNGGVSAANLLRARAVVRDRMPNAAIHVFDAPWPWLNGDGLSVPRHSAAEYVRNEFIKSLAPDAVLVCSLFEWPTRSVISIPVNDRPFTAVVGYDMLQVTDPACAVRKDQRPMLKHRFESMANADLVLTISDFTRREMLRLLNLDGERVRTIWGAGAQSAPGEPDLGERRGILCVGGDSLRKNEASTIRAFGMLPRELRDRHPLTIVGRQIPPSREELPRLAAALGLGGHNITILDDEISDSDLTALYQQSRLVVMPSRAEGLGLPILEAWSCGAPAIGSKTTSLGEIFDDPEWVFNPEDPAEQAHLIEKILSDEAAWSRCQDHGRNRVKFFTWNRTAERAVEAIELLLPTRQQDLHYRRADDHAKPTARVFVLEGRGQDAATAVEEVLSALSVSYSMELTRISDGANGQISKSRSGTAVRDQPAEKNRCLVVLANGDGILAAHQFLADLPPAVVVVCRPPQAPFRWTNPVTADSARYVFDANGIRPGDPDDERVLEPLAGASLGVLVLGSTRRTKDLSRPLLGSIDGVGDSSMLTARIEDLYACRPGPPPAGLSRTAAHEALARNRSSSSNSLYFDVTALARRPARSGIQRVTVELARNLIALNAPPLFTASRVNGYIGLNTSVLPELMPGSTDAQTLSDRSGQRIIPKPGDTLLVTDLYPRFRPWEPVLATWRAHGGSYAQVVCDLLPVHLEDFFVDSAWWFEDWLRMVTKYANVLVADSQDAANGLQSWLDTNPPDRPDKPVITWIRLGYDMGYTQGYMESLRNRPRGHRRVLVVGTIEPRKGVEVVMNAAETLWSRGEDVEFVLVGKPGWAMPSIINRLQALHDSDKPLTWLKDASDEELRLQYLSADLLVMASRGEGFGLPIVEALAHGVPVVARDLPVFRELLGDQDCYFRLDAQLPDVILRRLRSPDPICYVPERLVTWRDTTLDLMRAISLPTRHGVAGTEE
ncbi:MAG: glycosyltransferase family 1 protein [Actinomycetes bacterium]